MSKHNVRAGIRRFAVLSCFWTIIQNMRSEISKYVSNKIPSRSNYLPIPSFGGSIYYVICKDLRDSTFLRLIHEKKKTSL